MFSCKSVFDTVIHYNYLDEGDGESGIGDFSDPMTTPTALKSPLDLNAGLRPRTTG